MTSNHIIRSQHVAYKFKKMQDSVFAKINIFWFIWFFICFYPVTIYEFSVNYLFVLTPVCYVMFGGRLHTPTPLLKTFGTLCFGIFVIASFYQFDYFDKGLRRVISFFLFMSLFSLSFFNLKPRILNSALVALIVVSCLISLISVYKLISLDLLQNSFEAKSEVGSQRVGFLLIFSFWALLGYGLGRNYFTKCLIAGFSGLLLIGIFLTFSRASIVAFIGSGIIYFMSSSGTTKIALLAYPLRILFVTIFALIFIAFGEYFFPSIYQFMNERLFDFFASGRIMDNIANPETSEGTRIKIWSQIFSYVALNPVTGSGFLGVWILGDDTGSAHNQYFDLLMRLGFIGFFIYIYLLWRIWLLLLKYNHFLFCGFSGVLIFGMFHETFKESSGALLLGLLLSYYSSVIRRDNVFK